MIAHSTMKANNKVPTYDQLMNPLLKSIRDLGGSGSIDEIYDKVAENLQLPEEVLSIIHSSDTGNQTEVGYRLAWARTYLKKYGLLENSARGVWALTAMAKEKEEVDPQEVVRTVRALDRKESTDSDMAVRAPAELSQEEEWKQKLHAV